MQAIQITDGRTSLWQWDTGVRIKVYGCAYVDQMHFVTPAGVISKELVNNECDVPDAALQTEGLLKMYAYDRTENGGVTRCDFLLMVKARPKPADYIDPPDEYDNLEELAKRVASLIPGGGGGSVTPDQIGAAVEEYLTENPVEGTPGPRGEQGPQGETGPQGEQGPPGADGSDATVTAENVTAALGYTPADKKTVESLSEEIAAQDKSLKQLSDEVRGINGVTETVIVPIDDNDIIDGYLIMEGTGSQAKSDNWTCTDWIPVSFDGGSNITAKCVLYGSGAFVFYNSLKNPILSISGNNCSDYGIKASAEPQSVVLPCPKQTAYIRMSMLKSAYNTDGKGYELSGYVTNSLSNMIAETNRNVADVDRRLNLNVTNFYDKKVLIFGDSISVDYYGNYPKWVTHLTEERFFDVEKTANDSTHATGFVARYNGQPNDFITRMEAISSADTYDIVIVFGGINDYIQAIPMGESGGDKLTHFKPAVDYFFATLAERFVNARLLVLLPLRTAGYGNKNGAGCTQADYAEYIRTVAMQYALPVLNLMDDSGFNPKLPVFKNRWTLTEYEGGDGVTGDGVHPNEEYERRFLAPMIRAFLQSVM